MPRPGQVLGLVGTNGIGKSTALKVLAGKLKPNLGRFDVSPYAHPKPNLQPRLPCVKLQLCVERQTEVILTVWLDSDPERVVIGLTSSTKLSSGLSAQTVKLCRG